MKSQSHISEVEKYVLQGENHVWEEMGKGETIRSGCVIAAGNLLGTTAFPEGACSRWEIPLGNPNNPLALGGADNSWSLLQKFQDGLCHPQAEH